MIVLNFFFPLAKEQVSEVMVVRTRVREAAGERSGEVADMMRSGFLPETADRSARGSPSLFASLVWMIPPTHTHPATRGQIMKTLSQWPLLVFLHCGESSP